MGGLRPAERRPSGRHVLAGSGAGCVPLRWLGLELAVGEATGEVCTAVHLSCAYSLTCFAVNYIQAFLSKAHEGEAIASSGLPRI